MFLPLQITKCYPHERRKSRHSDNNVRYHYGTAEETPSRRGRLWLVEDASGGIEYFFGNIGEIIKEIRTIRISPTEIQTYVTESEYDSWNRIQKLTYPDGEILDYGYNRAGKLNKLLASSKKPIANSIIEQQGYDEFEQKVYRRFGNGIETHYTYDPVMRRLVQLKAEANRQSPTAPLQNNHYQYDLVGNILSIENAISQSPMAISQLGGSSRYAYEYDVLNRLTKASGQYNGSRNTAEYELNMSYNALNGITQKSLKHTVNGIDKGYTLNYQYDNKQHPNAPSSIGGFAPLGGQGDRRYTYDG
ncbi:MAG: hypothetical protein Q4G16_08150, partial [Cruoricaptor ignavus]|nr:hypothetical protein [Cruoricaptor ignavus]